MAAMAAESPPSTRLGTKDELRLRFGVSSATVSEALRLVQSQGLVRMQTGPGGGVFTAEPTGKLLLSNLLLGFRGGIMAIRDVLDAREALEAAVGQHAAAHRSPRDLRDLRKLIAAMEHHLDDPERYLRLNWQLHRRIAESAGNEVLTGIYSSLVRFLEEELTQAMADGSFEAHRRENLMLHAELVEAIADKDAEKASSLAAHHAPATICEAVANVRSSNGTRQRGARHAAR